MSNINNNDNNSITQNLTIRTSKNPSVENKTIYGKDFYLADSLNILTNRKKDVASQLQITEQKVSKKLNKNNSLPNLKNNNNLMTKRQINNKNLESNFKELGPEANKYTQSHKYIQNKECLIFDKYEFDNDEYVPDRAGIHNMKKIPLPPPKYQKIYKRTLYRNNKFESELDRQLNREKNKNLISDYNNENNHHDLFSHNDMFKSDGDFFPNDNNNKVTNSYPNRFKFNPYMAKIADSLYKNLNVQKNNLFEKYFLGTKNKSNDKNINTNRNKDIQNLNKHVYSTLLVRNTMDNIPLTFPKCAVSKYNFDTMSAEARQEKAINKLLKLKYLINIDRKNTEREYLREFLTQNGFDGDNIDSISLDFFSRFLRQKELKLNPNIPFKENLSNIINGHSQIFPTIPIDAFSKLNKFRHSNSCQNICSHNDRFPQQKKIQQYLEEQNDVNKKGYIVVPSNINLETQTKLYNDKDKLNENNMVFELNKELDNVKNLEILERKLMSQQINSKYKNIYINNDSSKNLNNNNNICNSSINNSNINQKIEDLALLRIGNFERTNSTGSQTMDKGTSDKNNSSSIHIDEFNNKFYYSRVDLPNSQDFERFKTKKKLIEFIMKEKQRKKEALNDILENSKDEGFLNNLNNNNNKINMNAYQINSYNEKENIHNNIDIENNNTLENYEADN